MHACNLRPRRPGRSLLWLVVLAAVAPVEAATVGRSAATAVSVADVGPVPIAGPFVSGMAPPAYDRSRAAASFELPGLRLAALDVRASSSLPAPPREARASSTLGSARIVLADSFAIRARLETTLIHNEVSVADSSGRCDLEVAHLGGLLDAFIELELPGRPPVRLEVSSQPGAVPLPPELAELVEIDVMTEGVGGDGITSRSILSVGLRVRFLSDDSVIALAAVEAALESCEPDGDGDGVPDAMDNCPAAPNPDQADTDGDGFADACDNCPATPNPAQEDFDSDGRGDVCADRDEDGLLDADDNCPLVPNGDQADGDDDGVGDVCDEDGDGVRDDLDNCPLVANGDQSDTDGDLAGDACDPDDAAACPATALSLRSGRFCAQSFWRDRSGNRGLGHPVAFTLDSGYFWFFEPDNVEVVTKVLDACTLPAFRDFWAFSTGLTDVRVLLRIWDLASGETRHYFNPLGRPFTPVLDTAAFPTCEAPPVAEMTPGKDGSPFPGRRAERQADDETALLNQERFAVSARFRTLDDAEGAAHAVRFTGDAAWFWFFDETNVEAVVKVLDACDLEGFRSFWVFAAGLTDVGVELRVEDTVSGEVWRRESPLGQTFQPIFDTGAFMTCDAAPAP